MKARESAKCVIFSRFPDWESYHRFNCNGDLENLRAKLAVDERTIKSQKPFKSRAMFR